MACNSPVPAGWAPFLNPPSISCWATFHRPGKSGLLWCLIPGRIKCWSKFPGSGSRPGGTAERMSHWSERQPGIRCRVSDVGGRVIGPEVIYLM
jgi:hypothetical protein